MSRDLLLLTIEQLPSECQEPLRKYLLDDQLGEISYADARITLQLVIAKAEVRGLLPCHLAWSSIAASISLLAAMDRTRLEARARCGFSHRELYWALECDMYGISTGGVTGSRRFARCLPCAIGKPGKCGASSAAWFCRRRLGMLNTCTMPASEKAQAIRLHGVTLLPTRSCGHQLARGLGEDGLPQLPSRKTVGPPPGPEDDGLLSIFDRTTWSELLPESNVETVISNTPKPASSNTATKSARSPPLQKKPETFVSQTRQLLESMKGFTPEGMWKEVTFACTKRYVGCLKRLAGKDSSKRKSQEAAQLLLGHAPKLLRRVDLQATQLKRWPDYDFMMALPETDTVLTEDERAASSCFLNTTTFAAIAEMQPQSHGLPPWHQHPDPANPGRYVGRHRPFPHNAPTAKLPARAEITASSIAVKTEAAADQQQQSDCPGSGQTAQQCSEEVPCTTADNSDTGQRLSRHVLTDNDTYQAVTCDDVLPLLAVQGRMHVASDGAYVSAPVSSIPMSSTVSERAEGSICDQPPLVSHSQPLYDVIASVQISDGICDQTPAAESLHDSAAGTGAECIAPLHDTRGTVTAAEEHKWRSATSNSKVDTAGRSLRGSDSSHTLDKSADELTQKANAQDMTDDMSRLLFGHVDHLAPLFTFGHPCTSPRPGSPPAYPAPESAAHSNCRDDKHGSGDTAHSDPYGSLSCQTAWQKQALCRTAVLSRLPSINRWHHSFGGDIETSRSISPLIMASRPDQIEASGSERPFSHMIPIPPPQHSSPKQFRGELLGGGSPTSLLLHRDCPPEDFQQWQSYPSNFLTQPDQHLLTGGGPATAQSAAQDGCSAQQPEVLTSSHDADNAALQSLLGIWKNNSGEFMVEAGSHSAPRPPSSQVLLQQYNEDDSSAWNRCQRLPAPFYQAPRASSIDTVATDLRQQQQQQVVRPKRGRPLAREQQKKTVGSPPLHPLSPGLPCQRGSRGGGRTVSGEQGPRNPTTEEDDFHRIWNSIRRSPPNACHSRHSSLPLASSRHHARNTSDTHALALPMRAPQPSSLHPPRQTPHVDVSNTGVQRLVGFSESRSVTPGGSDYPIRSGSELWALADPLHSSPEVAVPSLTTDTVMSMPPLLCATLSDLSFNLDGTWLGNVLNTDSSTAATAATALLAPPGDADSIQYGSNEALLAYTHCLHRLSSGFSEWRLLEPPLKKQQ